jgi:hypothetical protein
MRDNKSACKVLIGKSEGKIQLAIPGHRWKDNIKIDYTGIEWEYVGWIDMARCSETWRAVVNTLMNFSGSLKWGGGVISRISDQTVAFQDEFVS